MSKKQIAGVVVSIVLTGILFSLPKVMVEGKNSEANAVVAETPVAAKGESPDEESHDDHEGHDHGEHDHQHNAGMHLQEFTPAERQTADRLAEKIKKSENKEKVAIFADSLAALYAHAQKFDSAAYYAELALEQNKTLARLSDAGSYNLEAFKFAMEPARQKEFSRKAEGYLTEVLRQNPEQLEAKSKLAMIYVSSENPMKGIRMLQEVLDKDPENKEALFNMGILSVQSNQYGKAVERFERYTALAPENVQAQFYLAYSYMQLGRKEDARARFMKVKELDKNPDVLATVDEYLKEL